MRRCNRLYAVVCAIMVAAPAVATRIDGIVSGEGTADPVGYVPVLVANGELAMTVDKSFGIRSKDLPQYSQGIFLEGRRVGQPDRELLPQGRWRKCLAIDGKDPGEPVRWAQHLDTKTGIVSCRLEYGDGVVFTGETFVPFGQNTIAIKMTVEGAGERSVDLGIDFVPPSHPRIVGSWQPETPNRRGWAYRSYGYKVIDGVSAVHKLAPGVFIITFSDSLRVHPGAPKDYAALKAAHIADWAKFWSESYVRLPDPEIQRMWEMANYHLRINATPWSFPVGILNSHWQGHYFGFDEMYIHQGLLSSGHFGLARHAPDYRFATLGPALARNRYGRNKSFMKYGARYFWESVEDGRSEGTDPGEWMDHVFQMATIAKCAWQQYLYSRDRDWLSEKGYPVLLECARFYRNNMIYADSNGETYVGKCCDLERLGPSRERPFMTTCGVIFTLRAAAEASGLLKRNATEAADFRRIADALERSLPQKDGRYIACLNEPQESMATLAGFYPFPIFQPDHAPQREAVRHFIAEGRASGNMYPMGKRICPWYSGTMSAAATHMGDRAEPIRWLKEAFSAAGLFGEYFEINEPGAVCHPWFATAAGNCLYAINRMLVAGTVPEGWREYAFSLPTESGHWLKVEVKNGRRDETKTAIPREK